MKPDHFIYKSDGLYYMPNVPAVPDDREAESLGAYSEMMRQYYKTLERAKAEAVRICDEHQEILKKKIYDADQGRNTGVDTYFKEGEIYTINMEEKIEVAHQRLITSFEPKDLWRDCSEDEYNTLNDPQIVRKIARIAAPKKEEETQEQIWREAIGDIVNPRSAFEKGKNIDYLMTNFEIKRKPL